MDAAYDHIQEQALSPSESSKQQETQDGTFNTEIQEAYKAFSSSPWGARLGGFFGQVKKQGENLYKEAQHEYASGFSDLKTSIMSRARSMSQPDLDAPPGQSSSVAGPVNPEYIAVEATDNKASTATPAMTESASGERSENLPQDILHEAESMLSKFRLTAAQKLKEIEKAEDAADEALLKFGTNLRNFFRDAVTVTAPESEGQAGNGSAGKVLFESKDAEGKRVIHTTRFDAQLHVIHSSMDSFLRDPASAEYEPWASTFDVGKMTDIIGNDLEKYDELRKAMEQLVPERVEYGTFWARYYFLRHVIETEERRRKELLKGATANDEEVGWDEESEDETTSSTPNAATGGTMSGSTGTLSTPNPATSAAPKDKDLLKPAEPRKSNDLHSQADSDASYDLVSGTQSRAPGTPKDEKKEKEAALKEESDEEDWE